MRPDEALVCFCFPQRRAQTRQVTHGGGQSPASALSLPLLPRIKRRLCGLRDLGASSSGGSAMERKNVSWEEDVAVLFGSATAVVDVLPAGPAREGKRP